MPTSKPQVKRSKTFHGCWSCRRRHLKCDTRRPSCDRCAKSKLICEGYGIRLSWDHQRDQNRPAGAGKNRLRFDAADMLNPVFDPGEIDLALELLDDVGVGFESLVEGPYTVFSTNPDRETFSVRNDNSVSNGVNLPTAESSSAASDDADYTSSVSDTQEEPAACSGGDDGLWSLKDENKPPETSQNHDTPITNFVPEPRLLQVVEPYLVGSADERRLLHCWISSTSSIMIATGHPDNPYRTVMVPLAISAIMEGTRLLGRSALLHSLYACTASHLARSQQGEDSKRSHELAIKHYQRSIQYLRQSTLENRADQHGAILATIIIFAVMHVVNGNSSEWRIHLRGGRNWLKAIASNWQNIGDNHIIYQMFRGLEVFGYSHDNSSLLPFTLSVDLNQNPGPETEATQELQDNLEEFFAVVPAGFGQSYYCMDKFFGLTMPILNAILKSNSLVKQANAPTSQQLDILRQDILVANPCDLRFPSVSDHLERLTRNHSFTFYFALSVQYKRSLCRCLLRDVRYIVEDGLREFEAIAKIETETDQVASGLLWPLYILASEASDEIVRQNYLKIFAYRKRRGLAATDHIEEIVREVWRRRDSSSHPDEIYRHAVMKELGFDVLLT